ncbi:hypothetical protein ABES25_13545 [Bacillus gobiensis]|uniref:hypothetical protein n=1 Tax=Bacillus gobiensis TaxID=1441095 RepID=UPI003D234350
MNFETKHAIRWGIPGWVYLSILLIYFSLKDSTFIMYFIKSNGAAIVAFTGLFIGIGIIIGHLIHQISMLFGFVFTKKWAKYFREEFELDEKIMKHPNGSDIQRIYSYRLGNVHALRSLTFSFFISLISIISLSLSWLGFSTEVYVLVGVIVALNIIVGINYVYFQSNLDYFWRKVNDEYHV